MTLPPYVRIKEGNCYFQIVVAPGAKRDKIIGLHGDRLKIAIAAPPVDGKANQRLIRYLAEVLAVPQANIFIEKGEKSNRKSIIIQGMTLKKISVLWETLT